MAIDAAFETTANIKEVYDNFDELIQLLINLSASGVYAFRGYSKQEQLLPNIIRNGDLSKCESSLLEEFEHYGNLYFHATCPIDFMSYAQHFGLPTRLLDFTNNPFIALSFALYTAKESQYKVADDADFYYIRFCDKRDNIFVRGVPLKKDLYNLSFTRTDSFATRACQTIDFLEDVFEQNI